MEEPDSGRNDLAVTADRAQKDKVDQVAAIKKAVDEAEGGALRAPAGQVGEDDGNPQGSPLPGRGSFDARFRIGGREVPCRRHPRPRKRKRGSPCPDHDGEGFPAFIRSVAGTGCRHADLGEPA